MPPPRHGTVFGGRRPDDRAGRLTSLVDGGSHNGSRADAGFLIGNGAIAMHDTLMAFQPPVVNLDAASSS